MFTVTDRSSSFIRLSRLANDRGLAHAATDIMRLSKMQVPHRTGALQNSGQMERLGEAKFRISYATPYARRWEFTSPPHGFKEGRKSRYLRDPADQVIPKIPVYIKREY